MAIMAIRPDTVRAQFKPSRMKKNEEEDEEDESDDDEEDDRRPPGTSMLRLAGIIAACLLVLVAVVIAFNLGRGKTPLGTTRDESSQGTSRSPSPSTSAAVAPITGRKTKR